MCCRWSCRSRFMLAAAPSSDAPLLLRRLCPCDKPWDKPERGVFCSLSLTSSRLISADCSRSLEASLVPTAAALHSSPPISLSPTRHYTAIVLVAQSIWKPPFMSITSPVIRQIVEMLKVSSCATSSGLQKRRTGTVVRKQESNHIC